MSKRFCKRSWGWYLTLLDRKHFKVKLLWFCNKRSCSLQRHELRNELWLILYGVGSMQLSRLYPHHTSVRAGEFFRVRRNAWHKFTAFLNTMVLEIQYGDRCDEGDIVRA